MAFDLKYLKDLFEGLEGEERIRLQRILSDLGRHLVYDWRAEVFNIGIIVFHLSSLRSAAEEKEARKIIKRRKAVMRQLDKSEQSLYMTPGGPEAQLDLLTALISEKSIIEKLESANLIFKEKLRFLLTNMPNRRNSELGRLLELVLEKTKITAEDINLILNIEELKKIYGGEPLLEYLFADNFGVDNKDDNQSLFYSPLLRDKWAFIALEKEHAEKSHLFSTWENELNRILHYFPSFSYFRDGILKSFIEVKVENPEQLEKVNSLLLEKQENLDKEDAKRRVFGRDIVSWLASNTSLDTRRMILEWLLGWRMRKPPDLVEFEYRYLLNMEQLLGII